MFELGLFSFSLLHSLDGIVDHYKKEEIVNGFRLGQPVPPKVNTFLSIYNFIYLMITRARQSKRRGQIRTHPAEVKFIKTSPLNPLNFIVVILSDFLPSNSKLEVSKSNSWKMTSFLKTTPLQREPFLTMFYTINLAPLLVTK